MVMDNDGPVVYVSKSISVSTAHRLHSTHFSDEENKILYGKCNNEYGHGHNYKIKVTLKGPINTKIGMLINLTELKSHLMKVAEHFDHKNIDKQVAYFKDVPSTAENIAVFVWKLIEQELAHPEILYEVKIKETDNNIAFYRGG